MSGDRKRSLFYLFLYPHHISIRLNHIRNPIAKAKAGSWLKGGGIEERDLFYLFLYLHIFLSDKIMWWYIP